MTHDHSVQQHIDTLSGDVTHNSTDSLMYLNELLTSLLQETMPHSATSRAVQSRVPLPCQYSLILDA